MTALGIVLLVLGATAILIEAHVPTLGALGGPGVLALVAGTVLAVAGLGGGWALAAASAVVLGAVGLGTVWLSLRRGLEVRRRRISTGREGLVGHTGVVRSWAGEGGRVMVDGALWQARLSWPEEKSDLHEGDRVVVERIGGLTLAVRRAEEWEVLA